MSEATTPVIEEAQEEAEIEHDHGHEKKAKETEEAKEAPSEAVAESAPIVATPAPAPTPTPAEKPEAVVLTSIKDIGVSFDKNSRHRRTMEVFLWFRFSFCLCCGFCRKQTNSSKGRSCYF